MTPPSPPRILVRALPDSFVTALGQRPGAPPIDLARARAQHAAYVDALRGLGAEVHVLAADPALPDCCFVEDTAVVARGHALLTHPGAPSRRAEVAATAEALQGAVHLHTTPPSAHLEGGDVLRVDDVIFVGQSGRTDAGGLAAMRATFGPLGFDVRPVAVPAGMLHLKAYVSAPLPGVVVLAEGAWPEAMFPGSARVVRVPASEAYAANTVGVGARGLVVAAGFDGAAARLRAEGFDVVVTALDQFALADGSATCLSVAF